MPISDQGQLDLSTHEQFEYLFQDSVTFPASGGGNPIPAVAGDPGDGYRSVTKLDVTATGGSQDCGIIYEFAADQPEVWVEFDIRYTHPAGSGDGEMALFAMLDSSNGVVASLNRLTDSSTEWRAVNATTPGSFGLTTGIAKNAWERIRLRYKKATSGSNGILQAWRYNFGTASYDLQLNIANHDSTAQVRKFVIKSGPSGVVRSTSGSKTVWFRALTWGLEQSHVGFKHRGLQFGHVCTAGSGASTIDAQLWYRFPREYHGMQLGGSGDPNLLTIQFQYMLTTGSSWTNAGSAINFAPDGQGEMTAVGTATGLSPLTAYHFRAIIADGSSGSSFSITTETITCTTPTAASGEPGQLKYIYGSCAQSGPSVPSTHPHKIMSAIRDEVPHGFIHLGDMMYYDFEGFYNKDDHESGIRKVYCKAFVHDFDHRRLHESSAFFPMWDDHEISNNAWGANPDTTSAALFANANAAAAAYWVDRRINSIAGGKGWWFDTAKCRFVMMDMRTAKHIGSTSPPVAATMLGSTQHDAVKFALEDTGKPINFLFSPGPVVIGHGTGADADGWNQTAMIDQFEDILQHFHTTNDNLGSILIVCSGDRHYTYVATDWAGSIPYAGRIKPEWCSSPLAFVQREPTNLAAGGSSVQYVEPDLDAVLINRYCRIEIDEEELEVTMTLVNGATGQPMHANATSIYTASE